jgi:hypothetical protein
MKRLRGQWLYAIPVIWLGIALAVIEPGAIKNRLRVAFEFSLLFYDPADVAAFVLRGANASMGREPGRADEPKWDEPKDIEARLDGPRQPLAEKYYLEYPTATLVLFRLGFPTPCEMPAAVADAHQYGVAHFIPRNDSERQLWMRFHAAVVIHLTLMTAALVGLIVVLRRGYEPDQPSGPVWLAVLPAAVFFSLNRFDILPALATALGFAALGRGRLARSGIWFGLGTLLKVYPVLFVPIVLRHLGPARGAKWLAGFALTILFGVGLSTAFLGWEPTVRPILVQIGRPYEKTSWTLYGRVLPEDLAGEPLADSKPRAPTRSSFISAHSGTIRLAILGAVGLALVINRPANLTGVLRRGVILLTVFVALAVFWSPQWVVWYLPLVVPLAARHRWLLWTAVMLDLLNYLQFPVLFWVLWGNFPELAMRVTAEVLTGMRAASWAALIGGMVWCEFVALRRRT